MSERPATLPTVDTAGRILSAAHRPAYCDTSGRCVAPGYRAQKGPGNRVRVDHRIPEPDQLDPDRTSDDELAAERHRHVNAYAATLIEAGWTVEHRTPHRRMPYLLVAKGESALPHHRRESRTMAMDLPAAPAVNPGDLAFTPGAPAVLYMWLHRPTGAAGASTLWHLPDRSPTAGYGTRILAPTTAVPHKADDPWSARTTAHVDATLARLGWHTVPRATAARTLRGTFRLTTGHILNAELTLTRRTVRLAGHHQPPHQGRHGLAQMTHPETFARLSAPAQLLTLAEEGIGAYHFYATYDQQQAALSVGEALDAVRQLVARPDPDTSTVYVLGGGSPRAQRRLPALT
ncbi:hypothetical protein AB0M58_13785 [Streptomyces bobili]|uniref:hypothetical protein n=1 Tax=Streptomyces bobili TaxID=67280 RepID=UPI0034168C30